MYHWTYLTLRAPKYANLLKFPKTSKSTSSESSQTNENSLFTDLWTVNHCNWLLRCILAQLKNIKEVGSCICHIIWQFSHLLAFLSSNDHLTLYCRSRIWCSHFNGKRSNVTKITDRRYIWTSKITLHIIYWQWSSNQNFTASDCAYKLTTLPTQSTLDALQCFTTSVHCSTH